MSIVLSRKLLLLAIPMILSNITTPMLGMVDTAVMGHMGSVAVMSGAAIGALVISQLYWLCGFLRMATTGVSAQTFGQQDTKAQAKSFYQSIVIAFALGVLLLLATPLVLQLGFWFAQPHPDIYTFVQQYISVRLWGAPFAIINFAICGWLIGQQKMKKVLMLTVMANVINALLNIGFVFGLDMGIKGLALASVIAELSISLLGAHYVINKQLVHRIDITWLKPQLLSPFLKLNSAMFFRNLFLQCTLAFMTFQGARLGQDVVAVNAILMQFFVLTALGLDGIAQATEALVGESKGKQNQTSLRAYANVGILWSGIIALAYSVLFWLFSPSIIEILTDLPDVIALAAEYYWVIILLPLTGHWCFVFDGIFVALTRGKAMQNSMLVSSVFCFFPTWLLLNHWTDDGNGALWIALLSFLLARGATLWLYFYHLTRSNQLLD